MSSRVDLFNNLVGNSPVDPSDKEAWWEQLELQARLVLEEAGEMYKACKDKDIVEVLDGACDVKYTQSYMETLLKSSGIDFNEAFDEVCKNNSSKFTEDLTLAEESKELLLKDGVEVYLEELQYEATTYYSVKRKVDGKVLKLKGHLSPDIKNKIPEVLKE